MTASENEPIGVTGDALEQTSTTVSPSLDTAPETGDAGASDETRAPEEESQSEIPGDPRPPHQTQPPTKEQY